ncbi:MAG: hypothetical protein ACOYI2_04355 [Bacillota bacterium]|jgi:hypothetical protein
MKRLILGVFLLQVMIVVALGIPAGGAANAQWWDEGTGLLVKQENPAKTIESFFRLMENDGFDAAVLLFTEEERAYLSGDSLKENFQNTQINGSKLIKVFPSSITGTYAVVASLRTIDFKNEGVQPVISFHTLVEKNGKWEIIQLLNNANIMDVKQIIERALEVSNRVLNDPLMEFDQDQKASIIMQAEMGRQVLAQNLDQLNEMLE